MRGLFLRSIGLKLHLLLAVGAFTLAVLTTSASASTIWIGDAFGGAVEKFDASGAPLGLATFAPFPIGGMTTVGGEIWIGDAYGGAVEKFDASGAPLGFTAGVPFGIGGMTTVPIPGTIWLFGSALGLLGWSRRKAA
jgi:hypothetical protein